MKIELDSYSSFFYIALTFMISRREESIPPELLYILGPEDLLKFVDMFGGQKLYVPTRKELSVDLQSSLVAYYKYCENKTELCIMEDMNLTKRELNTIYIRIKNYMEYLKSEGLISPEIMKDLTDVSRRTKTNIC